MLPQEQRFVRRHIRPLLAYLVACQAHERCSGGSKSGSAHTSTSRASIFVRALRLLSETRSCCYKAVLLDPQATFGRERLIGVPSPRVLHLRDDLSRWLSSPTWMSTVAQLLQRARRTRALSTSAGSMVFGKGLKARTLSAYITHSRPCSAASAPRELPRTATLWY
jgi:hypothetical protein